MRCKNCKEQFDPVKFLQKYCLKDECIKVWVKAENEKQWSKKKSQMKADLTTLSDYLKITQQVFNKFIRIRDEGLNCISCDKPIKQGNVEAGHLWSSGGHSNIRFNELNVNSQCSRPCNKDKSGDINNYRLGFVRKYGLEKLEELDLIAKIEKKWDKDELQLLIKKYKQKIKELNK